MRLGLLGQMGPVVYSCLAPFMPCMYAPSVWVCAVSPWPSRPHCQQESCARVLLFRGANKDVRNYNSQTAFQVPECAGARSHSRGVWLFVARPLWILVLP